MDFWNADLTGLRELLLKEKKTSTEEEEKTETNFERKIHFHTGGREFYRNYLIP